MNPKTLTALTASIAHWLANSKATTPADASDSPDDCALCGLFYDLEPWCFGCPVQQATGNRLCGGSPYSRAGGLLARWRADPNNPDLAEAFRFAANEEYEFLKGLLPK